MYRASDVPENYDPQWLMSELRRLEEELASVNSSWIILAPQVREPSPLKNGMVVNADATYWNPGAGSGLYELVDFSWRKL